MCSLILSFIPNHPWPIIIAANRDEMLNRAWTSPAPHWPSHPGIIAGRDTIAGGTWLGLNRHSVMAALLNRTGSLGPAPGRTSRGDLPLRALAYPTAATAAAALAMLDTAHYRSFNLVIADPSGGFILRGLETGQPTITPLPPGLTMITAGEPNDRRDSRIARYRPAFAAAPRPDPAINDWSAWTALLADRSPPAETALNVTPRDGFGTICASQIGLSTTSRRLRFAAGPPDRAAFHDIPIDPIAEPLTACRDASPATASSS